MTSIAQTEIVETLAHVRGSFERQLAGAGRYRALRSIEDTLVDLMDDDDAVVQPLNGVRDLLIHRLQERPDFRALRTIDSIVPQLLDVLSLHAQQTDGLRSDVVPNDPAPNDSEALVLESAITGAVVGSEATEPLPSSVVEQADQQLDVSRQPTAATDDAGVTGVESASAAATHTAANSAETAAFAPIVPQSFNLATVAVPAQVADTLNIVNEPVDEQTSGAPHRLDADDAREKERAA